MSPQEPAPGPTPEPASELARILDAYLTDLRAGQAPDRAALLAAHPELAAQLESCLAALDFIHRAEHADAAVPPALGDFRVVREIGRGAMGVVYEAEQVSLKRRVALKVLRFGGAADAEAMERFRREAETVARLHHTNIVPIFAVACDNGVHFFAMQLIAGRSLSAELAQAKAAGRPLDAKAVAGWGVQAAEALAHAHARGVVHRDVKPSNLLLDGEGVVWLTDFGLARRSDEATLTVAGVLLGTPLYMSPEQAAALDRPVDQRSDVYSLGATLYELATGRPVFEAALAKQLLEQIATAEPAAPRRVRPELPRDLETVLLKCLAKEPARRYQTARDLADDLRRVVSGDPVKARRPGLLLRLGRWARRRRAPVRPVAVAIAATVVLGLAGLLGWNAYREARKGSVTLQFEGVSGRGEILAADGKHAVPPFTLPTLAPIELPRGWYSLRVTQPGRLSEEYELLIEEGRHRTFTVGNNDQQLWEPMPIKGNMVGDFGVLKITRDPEPPRSRDGFVLPPVGVVIQRFGKPAAMRGGAQGEKKWEQWVKFRKDPFVPAVLRELRLKREDQPALARLKLSDGEWDRFCEGLLCFGDKEDRPCENRSDSGRLKWLQPAPDLDGDGVGDLVFLFGRFVLAISGKEGKVLWCRELHSNVFLRDNELLWRLTYYHDSSVLVLSTAQAVAGVMAPFPLWMAINTENRTELAAPPLVVADIDGDGHPDLILSHGAFSFEWQGVCRPCVEAVSGRTGKTIWPHKLPGLAERLVLFKNSTAHRAELLRDRKRLSEAKRPRVGFASLAERPTDKGRTLLAGLYDKVEHLDVFTGRPLAPPTPSREGGSRMKPETVWKVVDWSADGKIAFAQTARVEETNDHDTAYLRAIDTVSGKVLHKEDAPRVLADLDGDGVPEIITASGVFDVATGKRRWSVGDETAAAVLAGPDFDGDGWRDLFVTGVADGARFGHPLGVKVLLAGLRSGKDGRLLWLTAEPIPAGRGSWLHFLETEPRADFAGAVFYWRNAPGTAGHFVVNVGGAAESCAFVFAADTGRLAHVWPGVTVEGIADLDGDGRQDLYGRTGDQLLTARGTDPEVWRRPGRWRWNFKSQDMNSAWPGAYITGPVAQADLDGDGVADVVLYRPEENNVPTLQAYSGRDGRPLWTRSNTKPDSLAAADVFPRHAEWVECLDLDGKGRPVVVIWGDYHWCAVLDGRTGKGWLRKFDGSLRPDLLYRQPDGRLALVYKESEISVSVQRPVTGVLVAIDAEGKEVGRWPVPEKQKDGQAALPEGIVDRGQRSEDSPLAPPFGEDGPSFGFPEPDRVRDWLYPVGRRVDPSDSARLQLYSTADDKTLTILRREVPNNPPPVAPPCIDRDKPEPVAKRPLPWLASARNDWVAGVVSVAAYLALVVVLAALGRRKTALFLLAVFILLPAFAAVFGLVLVLALLVAAVPWKTGPKGHKRPLDFTGTVWGKSTLGLLLLPAALLTHVVLGVPALNGAVTATPWTYPLVLVPLIVLAAVGWKKTALGLLVPCLLLLVSINWPARMAFTDGVSGYLLSFRPRLEWLNNAWWVTNPPLLSYEAWDWSGWYWLWPDQLSSWRRGVYFGNPLTWALALVACAEFLRLLARSQRSQERVLKEGTS